MLLQSIFQFGNTIVESASSSHDWFDYLTTSLLVIIAALSFGATIASVRASNASLDLSRKLAENYDAKKLFIQNQIEEVCKFIRLLNKFYLQMAAPYKDELGRESIITSSVHFATLDEKRANNISSDFTRRQLSVTDEFTKVMGAINDYSKEIYFPLELKVELEKLFGRCSNNPEQLNNKTHYTFLTFTTEEYFTFDPKYIMKVFPQDKVYLDVPSYLMQVARVKKAAKNWLAQYGINANI